VTEQPKTPPLDLSHLHPAVRQAALLPADQPLAVIRADRWIGYPRASQALARLEALLAWPTRQRMPNMLLIGPTNNGKVDDRRCPAECRRSRARKKVVA